MSKNNNVKEVNENSFWYKYKNDKKYNAKVQLIIYFAFIVIVVVYVSVSRVGKNYDYNNVTNNINSVSESSVGDVMDTINNNYNYSIVLNAKIKKSDDLVEDVNYVYSGKVFDDNMIIERKKGNSTDNFYRVSSEYYTKKEDNYKYIDVDIVYDFISYKYIEIEGVKNIIKKASLDHVDESNGESNYVYNLLVRDYVKSYKGDDVVIIDINKNDNYITIEADYTNLFKEISDNIIECKIKYNYSEIGKIDKFVIIDNN